MTEAIERARAAQEATVKADEFRAQIRRLHTAFVRWQRHAPDGVTTELDIPDMPAFPYGHITRKPSPIEPNKQGERARWVYQVTDAPMGTEKQIHALFQFWGAGVPERKPPTYQEQYIIDKNSIFDNDLGEELTPDRHEVFDDICTDMERLTGLVLRKDPLGTPPVQEKE